MYKALLIDWSNIPVRGVALKTLKGINMHIYIHACMYIIISLHTHTHTQTRTHTNVHTQIHAHKCVYTHTHTHTHTHTGLFTLNDVQNMVSEITTMKEFDHPHVMSLIGVCLDAGPGVSMVMPFMTNGSLLDYLKKERSNLLIEEEVDMDKVAIIYV